MVASIDRRIGNILPNTLSSLRDPIKVQVNSPVHLGLAKFIHNDGIDTISGKLPLVPLA